MWNGMLLFSSMPLTSPLPLLASSTYLYLDKIDHWYFQGLLSTNFQRRKYFKPKGLYFLRINPLYWLSTTVGQTTLKVSGLLQWNNFLLWSWVDLALLGSQHLCLSHCHGSMVAEAEGIRRAGWTGMASLASALTFWGVLSGGIGITRHGNSPSTWPPHMASLGNNREW